MRHSFSKVADTLDSEVRLARDAGMATNPMEIRSRISIAGGRETAAEFRRAFALIEKVHRPKDWDKVTQAYSQGSLSEPQLEEIRQVTGSCQEAFSVLRGAAPRQGVDWNRPWEDGPKVLFPEYAKMKDAAKLLCLRAEVEARAGRLDDALQLCLTSARIGWHSGQEPLLIASLVSYAIEGITHRQMVNLITRFHGSADLIKFRKALALWPRVRSFEEGLSGEMVMMRVGIEQMRGSQPSEGDFGQPENTFFGSWLVRDPNYRKAWQAKLVRYDRLGYAASVASKTWRAKKDALDKVDSELQADSSLENFLNRLYGGFYSATPDSWARAIANRRILACSIEIYAFKLARGALPKSIPLIGDTSIDPFTLNPLGYRILPSGFKVYSVDSDCVDDGGLTRQEDRHGKSKTHDIASVFP